MVVLLMLIPLLAPSETGSAGFSKIAKALGLAAVKVGLPACIWDIGAAAHCHVSWNADCPPKVSLCPRCRYKSGYKTREGTRLL